MFGLSRLYQERESLYKRTCGLRDQALHERKSLTKKVLLKMAGPEGIVASFILGLTTQCDQTRKIRSVLLQEASKALFRQKE